MAMVLISKPIQINNQFVEMKVIKVPNIKLNISNKRMKGFISRGRILTNIIGVWAQKLI